ncbi:hypothetical protein B0H11DRAFT_1909174 [Mycena galericulata]|nr:hypothetical protein B0H11DRAFT_1909174 [Mycena galericulata]
MATYVNAFDADARFREANAGFEILRITFKLGSGVNARFNVRAVFLTGGCVNAHWSCSSKRVLALRRADEMNIMLVRVAIAAHGRTSPVLFNFYSVTNVNINKSKRADLRKHGRLASQATSLDLCSPTTTPSSLPWACEDHWLTGASLFQYVDLGCRAVNDLTKAEKKKYLAGMKVRVMAGFNLFPRK